MTNGDSESRLGTQNECSRQRLESLNASNPGSRTWRADLKQPGTNRCRILDSVYSRPADKFSTPRHPTRKTTLSPSLFLLRADREKLANEHPTHFHLAP